MTFVGESSAADAATPPHTHQNRDSLMLAWHAREVWSLEGKILPCAAAAANPKNGMNDKAAGICTHMH